jgi:hypothetical protein
MTSEEHYAALVYFPRENPRLFQVFTFAYDPSWHSELVLRIELLKHAIETGELPPIPADYDATKFPCRWFSRISRMVVQCPFYEQCWQAKKQEQEEEPKVPEEGNEENLPVYDMPDEIEEIVALLHSIRTQKKSLEGAREGSTPATSGEESERSEGAGSERSSDCRFMTNNAELSTLKPLLRS